MADTREEQAYGRQIAHQIACHHGLTIHDLTGRDRSRHVVDARHEAMAAVYRRTALSSTQVGALFGGRDHTTVLNAIRRTEGHTTDVPDRPVVVTKHCSRCGEVKPASEFHRHNRPNGDGLQGYCRTCANESKRSRNGTRKRRRHGADVRQTSMLMDRKVYELMTETAGAFGVSQSELIEEAVRREVRRRWTTCRRCEQAARVAGTELCGSCIAATRAVAS